MFCGKCGAKIENAGQFCPYCGAPLRSQGNQAPFNQPFNQPVNQPIHQTSKIKKYVMIGVLAVVVILAVCLLKSCLGNTYEAPVKNIVKMIEKQDAGKMLDLFPDDIWDAVSEKSGMSKSDVKDLVSDQLMEELLDEYDGKISLKYDIVNEINCTDEEVQEIRAQYAALIGKNIKIKDAKRLNVRMKVYTDGEKVEDDETEIVVIKVRNKWYLDCTSLL